MARTQFADIRTRVVSHRPYSSLERLAIGEADGSFGTAHASLTSQTGVVGAGAEKQLVDTSKDFLDEGVSVADFINIGTEYFPIRALSATTLTTDTDMTASASATYTVYVSPPRKDLTNSSTGVLFVAFNGTATQAEISLLAEDSLISTRRAVIDSVTLTGSKSGGGAAHVFSHGGCFVIPRVDALTTGDDGTIDVVIIPGAY